MTTFVGLSVAAVLVWLIVGGCRGTSPPRGPACLPEPPTATPAALQAGAQITLASKGFVTCGDYPGPVTYTATLDTGGQPPTPLGSVVALKNGSFSATLTIPTDTPAGDYFITLTGSPWDNCRARSCAAYGAHVVVAAVVPASG